MVESQHASGALRRLRVRGLVGFLLCAGLAGLLWVGADAVGTRECFDTAYGLPAERGGMTERGCEVTIATRVGPVTTVLPTLDEGIAFLALLAGLAGAVPPGICLWLATRRRPGSTSGSS